MLTAIGVFTKVLEHSHYIFVLSALRPLTPAETRQQHSLEGAPS